jgi:3-phenylpropionate/trans-cinnamate dioxygenase ferredoxin reductase subunit
LRLHASLRKKGMEITVIEAGERILARVASKPLAEHLHKLHVDNGVTVITNVGVEAYQPGSWNFSIV